MICSENVYKGAWPDMASKGAPRSAICVRRGTVPTNVVTVPAGSGRWRSPPRPGWLPQPLS